MTWTSYYRAPDITLWQGRKDLPPASCFFQIIYPFDLTQKHTVTLTKTTFGVLGFCSDEGVKRNFGRIGAADGPNAIRQALGKLPVQKSLQLFDAGDIVCVEGDLEEAQIALGEAIHLLFKNNIIPIVLGGGHEVAWGHYQGINRSFPKNSLGIINFDSHFDLRPQINNQSTSGTAFSQIAEAHKKNGRRFDYNCIGIQHAGNIRQLLEMAKQYDTHVIWADELHQGQGEKCVDFIDRIIDQNEIIYLSLCLDVFAAAFAPGVSSIQPLGLLPWHVIPLIRQLAASGKVISYDIAELAPPFDIDHCTAKLAASLIYELIHHHNESPRPW